MIDRYGFSSIKLKGGVFPPDEEIAAIRALREAFPEHPLRLDPNGAWTVETSLQVAEELDGVLEYLEDPTPGIAGMAEVAAQAPMPLATNMCVASFARHAGGGRAGRRQVVLVRPPLLGRAARLPQLAGDLRDVRASGCPCTPTPTSASASPR